MNKKLEPQDFTVKFTKSARKEFNLLKTEYGLKNASIALLELIKNYRGNNKI